jgi:hypothetical protein
MNRRSFLKRTAAFVAVAVGVPATMIPKVLEAAPVVPALTFPPHAVYPSFKSFIPELWSKELLKQAHKGFFQ